MDATRRDARHVRIGSRRYVDTGTGWRVLIETKGGGSVKLTRGEALYVEQAWQEHCNREVSE